MKNIKQRAIVTSIDDLNKNFEVEMTNCPTALETADDGIVLLPMPKEQLSAYFEVGDLIEFKIKQKNSCEMFNLSCQILRLSKFKRDLISILRRLDNDDHPLKRCILLNEDGFVLLSAKKNPEKLMLLQKQMKSEDNHAKF